MISGVANARDSAAAAAAACVQLMTVASVRRSMHAYAEARVGSRDLRSYCRRRYPLSLSLSVEDRGTDVRDDSRGSLFACVTKPPLLLLSRSLFSGKDVSGSCFQLRLLLPLLHAASTATAFLMMMMIVVMATETAIAGSCNTHNACERPKRKADTCRWRDTTSEQQPTLPHQQDPLRTFGRRFACHLSLTTKRYSCLFPS